MTVPSQCVLALNSSDVIAIVALLVAGLSALYARWAAIEAKRANELALHPHIKAIYDAFYELKMHMEQRGTSPEKAQVSKFYYPSREAALYLKEPLSNEISEYYSLCFTAADRAPIKSELNPTEMAEVKDSCSKARELAIDIDSALKAHVQKYAANG